MISLTKPTMVQIAGAAKAIKTERKKMNNVGIKNLQKDLNIL